MHITVIGTGYVGLVVGTGLADFGMKVTCVDSDEEKVKNLNKGDIPIYEPGVKELIKRNVLSQRLFFSTDIKTAIEQSLVIFITVGTPDKGDGVPDLLQIEVVIRQIALYMDDYKVIVIKSTVPVGTGAWIKKIIKENQREKAKFDVISNPEFLREGSALEDFMRPNRVVIGSDSEQALAIIKDIYRPLYLIETPFVVTNTETAEMIKYASNAFLATKISFINEVANLCEKVGADVHHVAKAMGLDKRIGPKFLHPGPGFGGSCFPKDTRAFSKIAKNFNCQLKIVDAVIEINDFQRKLMVEKIIDLVADIKGKTVGVLGLSFKPNTSDMRESPSIYIIQDLIARGAKIKAYDPAAMEESKKILKSKLISYHKDPYKVAKESDILVFVTEWNEFRNLDLERIKGLLKSPLIVDLRNIYDPHKMRNMGFEYRGIGRD